MNFDEEFGKIDDTFIKKHIFATFKKRHQNHNFLHLSKQP